MRIAVGADHAGRELKDRLVAFLKDRHLEVSDYGASGEGSVDYPDFAEAVAEAVAQGKADRGLLICGTGIGMSIAANKVPGVRAALCHDAYTARMSRMHNDANVLTLGAWVVGQGVAQETLAVWLDTAFEGGRHQRRIEKIHRLEQNRS